MNLHLKGNLKSLQLQAPSPGWLRSWWELAQGSSITFLQKVSRLPSICPSPAYPLPFFIFSPTVRPPNSPTTLGARQRPSSTPSPPNLCLGPLLPGELREERQGEEAQPVTRAAFVHHPQLTLVIRSAMASSAPGSSSVRRRALEPPTSRELESTTGQQPFLRSTPGGIGPRLRFKPRTAPVLLACSWHSLASHWRRLVPLRMHFQGDPAKTFGRGRG